jgi:hypothetical protein
MTLKNFLKNYDFSRSVSVSIYEAAPFYDEESGEMKSPSILHCDKASFSRYDKSQRIEKKLECWKNIKNRKVKRWNIIGDPKRSIQLIIELKPEK